jgi:hypothetical protein
MRLPGVFFTGEVSLPGVFYNFLGTCHNLYNDNHSRNGLCDIQPHLMYSDSWLKISLSLRNSSAVVNTPSDQSQIANNYANIRENSKFFLGMSNEAGKSSFMNKPDTKLLVILPLWQKIQINVAGDAAVSIFIVHTRQLSMKTTFFLHGHIILSFSFAYSESLS